MLTQHDLFNTLLNDPPGTYALVTYGNTHAVILKGCSDFRRKGYNLFVSYGGEQQKLIYAESPLPPLHLTDQANTVWFCQPKERSQLALALYFNAQLVRANLRDVIDDEGDFVEVVCDKEAELWEEAQQLACTFMVSHMLPDHRVIHDNESTPATQEHGIGNLDTGESA